MNRFTSPAFRRGFRAMLPLWLGAAPIALAYVIAAQKAGLTPLETQLMSVTVSSAAVQVSMVQMLSTGAPVVTIVIAALALSLHHFLYGLSLARRTKLSRSDKVATAFLLTDAAYGLTIADKGDKPATFLLGAEMSMFVVWNLFTALGLLLGHVLVVPASFHLEFVAPLTFLILLVSISKTRLDVSTAIISAAITCLCLVLHVGATTIFIAGIGSAIVGVWLWRRDNHGVAPRSVQA